MLPKSLKIHHLFFCLVLMSAFLLSSCAGQVQSQPLETEEVSPEPMPVFVEPVEVDEEESATEPKPEAPQFVSHEEARDIAMAYLLEKYALEAPDIWTVENRTPENLVGSSSFLFTSGAWVAEVEAPVVAPEYLVYSIEISHVTVGLRWQGEVDAVGNLAELSVFEPLEVLSPEDARDAAAAFIVEAYGWENPEAFIEQGKEPTENAGVRITFTSGPWVVQVEFLAAAPIVPEYRVTADHMSLVARWIGEVKADGQIIEEDYLFE